MVTVFWDAQGVIHHEYMPKNQSITGERYRATLDRVQEAIKQKRRWRGNVYFQQDNASSHTAKETKAKIKELGWKLLPHPPYSPDLAPSDFHLFLSMANAQKGAKFANEEEAKAATDEFLRVKEAEGDFFRRGLLKLPERWQKCIAVNGEYFED